jgi:hypothetical protein
VAGAVGEAARLRVRLVEQHEVAQPAQAEPAVAAGRARRSARARRNSRRDRSGSETAPSSR